MIWLIINIILIVVGGYAAYYFKVNAGTEDYASLFKFVVAVIVLVIGLISGIVQLIVHLD